MFFTVQEWDNLGSKRSFYDYNDDNTIELPRIAVETNGTSIREWIACNAPDFIVAVEKYYKTKEYISVAMMKARIERAKQHQEEIRAESTQIQAEIDNTNWFLKLYGWTDKKERLLDSLFYYYQGEQQIIDRAEDAIKLGYEYDGGYDTSWHFSFKTAESAKEFKRVWM